MRHVRVARKLGTINCVFHDAKGLETQPEFDVSLNEEARAERFCTGFLVFWKNAP